MSETITKSIRLREEEAEWLKMISRAENMSESALMKRLIYEGLKTYRLEKAAASYSNNELHLADAARVAGVGIRKMMAELEKRGISIHSSEEMFLEGLESLAEMFDDPLLRSIALGTRNSE